MGLGLPLLLELLLVLILVLALILPLIPALVAKNKGRGFSGWYIYGCLLFPVALVHSLITKGDREGMEKSK